MKFKWIIMSIVMLLCANFSAIAQEKGTSEFVIGIGGLTSNDLLNDISNLIVTGTSVGNVNYSNTSTFGAVYLGYRYTIVDRWVLGLAFVYQQVKEDVKVNGSDAGEAKYGYYTVGIESDYRYISREAFQMYSGIGVGFTFQDDKYDGSSSDIADSDDRYFNFQINALGFRFGKAFGGFLELGYGYKGVVNAGVSYQF
ncbi:hypothetical protein V6R21_17210 [Limibacter armeniacum]|uniref:hypothetical protein n=1 Tax=Limibacter armeniacum TaxID=466084 RepID=UPI002FE63A9C